MSKTANLFTAERFKNLLYAVEKRERVVVERFFVVDGNSYELEDLYNTLSEVKSGYVFVERDYVGKMLMDYGVLSTCGGREYAAREGDNFDAFFKIIQDAYRKS